MRKLLTMVMLVTMTSNLWAATKSVTLSVPGMNCATCPITVKKALSKVSGVNNVEVSLNRREAKVTFDELKTGIEALTRATRDAGFPSTVVGDAK